MLHSYCLFSWTEHETFKSQTTVAGGNESNQIKCPWLCDSLCCVSELVTKLQTRLLESSSDNYLVIVYGSDLDKGGMTISNS